MLIDMNLLDKTVLIFGSGKVGERKAAKFLAAGAKVVVVSKDFVKGIKRLGANSKLQLVNADLDTDTLLIDSWISNADLVIAATNDHEINAHIAEKTRKRRTHVSVVDAPQLGDFTLPVISRVGEFQIAISTGGKSPAMARLLGKKVEEVIREQDILMVRLQAYSRELARIHFHRQQSRKKVLYTIIEDPRIRRLLKHGSFQEAKTLAKRIIESQRKVRED